MAQKINGWTISERTQYGNKVWQAVNDEGTVGIQSAEIEQVTKFAKKTDPKNYGKR